MAPPKSKPAQPIDRPLSRAYLREFSGWSTAYSPGLSEPTSLKEMRNCYVTREGALAVRPGLRSIFSRQTGADVLGGEQLRGSFETFYTPAGERAILYTTSSSGQAKLRGATYNAAEGNYLPRSLSQLGFTGETGDSKFIPGSIDYMRYLQIDNKIFCMPLGSAQPLIAYVGETRKIIQPSTLALPGYRPDRALSVYVPDPSWINIDPKTEQTPIPAAANPGAPIPSQPTNEGTLRDNGTAGTQNIYNLAYFYTISNEFGESLPSSMTFLKVRRPPSQWFMRTPDSGGGPSGTDTVDPSLASDQLVAVMPTFTPTFYYTAADGLSWNLYMLAWSPQAPMPTEGTLIGTRRLTNKPNDRWLQHTPVIPTTDSTLPLPTRETPIDYSAPPRSAQGLVASDRLILVNNRDDAALIRWSSNQMGDYFNFSPSRGGGYKTLSSGNILRPVCVKLWQNPQSVDTIVILCQGVDGYSTSYYMSPASVSGQTSSTSIMGFEETTATPGTVSPFGVEVVNQALYHPLDDQLMKSTAANYNINHKSMTELIANKWVALRNKDRIVSAELNNRIYYIVDNPDGIPVPSGCRGNELWVLDVGGPNPVWSRWTIPAQSLHKIELKGKVYMGVVKPEGIFVLDDEYMVDDVLTNRTTWSTRGIDWYAETNTQGANRAHDAWAFLQQVNITFGSFTGVVEYGIHGIDNNGMPVQVTKIFQDLRNTDYSTRPHPWDIEDFMRVGRTLKEWSLHLGSMTGGSGQARTSFGQVNLVQYRYTPASVNVGYDFGSVETFEYGRSLDVHPAGNVLPTGYPNGIPAPYIDTSRS